jgi:hypothetical protein
MTKHQSPRRPIPYWLSVASASAVIAACSADGASSPPGNLRLISLRVQDSIPANGSIDTLIARVDSNFTATNAVTFSAPLGAFVNGTPTMTVVADPDGVAKAYLKAPTSPARVGVSATAAGMTRVDTITFVTSPAERLVTVATPSVLHAVPGDTSVVTVTVFGRTGSVSGGGMISFEVLGDRPLRDSVQLSVPFVSASAGSGSTRLTLLSSQTGQVTVRASFVLAGATTVGEAVILVAKPTASP